MTNKNYNYLEDNTNSSDNKYAVELINTLDQFYQLKNNWEDVYATDPEAQMFLSWLWLYGWFETTPFNWFILCVREVKSNEYIAFLPLIENNKKIKGFSPVRRLTMGGQPFAVYTGFLCKPGLEETVFPLLSDYIQQNLKWDAFRMTWLRDTRLDIFLSGFSTSKNSNTVKESLTSLYIKLPPDFEIYLMKYLSRKNRKTYKKKVRAVENSEEFHISVTTSDSTEKEINAMMELWEKKWNQEREAGWYRHMLHHYLKNDLLWLFVIWKGEKPVGALSCLLDPAKNTVHGYITSYDPEYASISAGIVTFMKAIEYSIDKGFKIFDFAVGLDRYKLSFGPKRQKTYSVTVQNKTFQSRLRISSTKWLKRIVKLKK